jgi:hypothetical protein
LADSTSETALQTDVGRGLALVFACLLAVTWGLCGLAYAFDGGGAYGSGIKILIGVPVALSVAVIPVSARAWLVRSRLSALLACAISLLAIASVLVLTLAILGRG